MDVGRWEIPVLLDGAPSVLTGAIRWVPNGRGAAGLHLHGYDRSSFVTAGATTTLRFVADVPGAFEVELEQRGAPLAQLQIS